MTGSATPVPMEPIDHRSIRDDEDVAAVLAVLSAFSGGVRFPTPEPRTVWADPAHRLGVRSTAPAGWWASGLPR